MGRHGDQRSRSVGRRRRLGVAGARGAEIYFGFGVPSGVAAAAKDTLRWAHTATAGIGSSLAHMSETRVMLTNSAGVHAEPMADWVVAAIGYFIRGLNRMVSAQRQGRWAKEDFTDGAVPMREFRGLRLGVFGLGGIGTAVARRGLALGMKVSGVRRRPERSGPKGVEWVGGLADLARLAGGSDVLVIAAPSSGSRTRHSSSTSRAARSSTSRRSSSCWSGGG